MNWSELTTIILPTFAIFFVVIDPIGIVPFFMTLTEGKSKAEKSSIALRSIVLGTIILTLFAVAGKALLGALGISLPAFKIAGGLLLFLIAVEMLFEKRTERRQERVEDTNNTDSDETTKSGSHNDDEQGEDVAVFPLAVPFIAGPGSMATIILLMSKYEGHLEKQIVVYLVMLTCLLTCYIMFRFTTKLEKIITPRMTKVATRLLGVLLAALSVEFVLSGLNKSVLFM